MAIEAPHPASPTRPPLRLWPGVVLAVSTLALRYGAPLVMPGSFGLSIFGGVIGGLLIALWWLFFSRAAWLERIGALALAAVALFVTQRLADESIATGGMGLFLYLQAIPVLGVVLVAWAVLTRRLDDGPRRASLAAAVLLACLGWTLVRMDGITGEGDTEFAWRWAETAEQELLDEQPALPAAGSGPVTGEDVEAAWPGFRGPARDGRVPTLRVATDWSTSPPRELWRRPVGPGWSSFAVRGNLIYTQEQRGEDEVVAAYRLDTGEPVWAHRDAARFWEAMGGAGPRATPTVVGDRLYALGATGILNALSAADGTVQWSRNLAADTGAENPGWGFSGSPLVVGDLVVAAASGSLAAYDRHDGSPRWQGPLGTVSYSSPHAFSVGGVPQTLLMRGDGVAAVALESGEVLWEHEWPGAPIVQPAVLPGGDLLITDQTNGARRLEVSRGSSGWEVEERWTSRRLKPYYNDFVVHEGHAYGFDGSILACIDLEDGSRAWKGGRYGNGQLVLLSEQDLLLVLSEEGDLVLVEAKPEGFAEVTRAPGIEGKTWNHPVVVGDRLLVRNGEEMAAFRLPRVET